MLSNENDFYILLQDLGISSDWEKSAVLDALDELYSKELELYDLLLSRGEDDSAQVSAQKIEKIELALDYCKNKYKKMVGLIPEKMNSSNSLDGLKQSNSDVDFEKARDILYPSTQPGVNSSHNSVENHFKNELDSAKRELSVKNWKYAFQIYDDLLDLNPEHPEANLGMFMANNRISSRKEIIKAAYNAKHRSKDLFTDQYYRRAMRYGSEQLKKELSEYEKCLAYELLLEKIAKKSRL